MSIPAFRKNIKDFLDRPTGPFAPPVDASSSMMDSQDGIYRNRNVLQDLSEMVDALKGSHQIREEHLAEAPSNTDEIIKNNETIVLWKNLHLALEAYLVLGSNQPLAHGEQQKMLDDVRKLPQLLREAHTYFKEVCEEYKSFDRSAAAEMASISGYCETAAIMVGSQLRVLDGQGRGMGPEDPKKP